MANWTAVVDKPTGALVSVGTVLAPDASARFDVVDLGPTQPDFALVQWDAPTRTLVARPAPVMVDRLDDVEALFRANADIVTVFQSLSPVNKVALIRGLRTVLAQLLSRFRYRQSDTPVGL